MTEDRHLLEQHGWVLECESPFEIRHTDGSFATGYAAELILQLLKAEPETRPCHHCNGTGEIKVEWWVCYNYQGDYQYAGPYRSRQEAETVASLGAGKKGQPQTCYISVMEQRGDGYGTR